jgi:hypothetical protein
VVHLASDRPLLLTNNPRDPTAGNVSSTPGPNVRGLGSKMVASRISAKSIQALSRCKSWQEWQDSNLQPPVLETGALPIELHSCGSGGPDHNCSAASCHPRPSGPLDHHGGTIGQHLGDAVGDLVGVVAHGDDGVGAAEAACSTIRLNASSRARSASSV